MRKSSVIIQKIILNGLRVCVLSVGIPHSYVETFSELGLWLAKNTLIRIKAVIIIGWNIIKIIIVIL